MAKEVTVLGLEGAFLRGVQLVENGTEYVRHTVDSWPAIEASEPAPEVAGEDSPPDGNATGDNEAAAGEASDAIVEQDTLVTRAFRSAAKRFGRNEFALALPLSRMLVKCVRLPASARDDLQTNALSVLDEISPFPDEALAPAVEVVAETDQDLLTVVAALPAAAAAEIGEALLAAKVRVTRTDVTTLGWLRTLWPRISEVEARRRVVLCSFGDGWDLLVLDDGAPTMLRGIGFTATAADLSREVTLSLLQSEASQDDVGDVAVCSTEPVPDDVLDALAAFGSVRLIQVEDSNGGVEGCARREVEGGMFDATPDDWVEARTESRFTRKLMIGVGVAVGIWLALMGVLYGVDVVYEMMQEHQKTLRMEPKHKRAFEEVKAMTNRVALIERYSDRAHCALEMLKLVSDSLPDSDEVTFRSFNFVHGVNVRVQGTAQQREDLRTFVESLEGATERGEEDAPRVFSSVKQKGGETETRNGLRFAIEANFPESEEDGRSK